MDPTAWIAVYRRLLPHAVCLDIETTGWNGNVAVVGLYRPKEGAIEVTQFVRGQTLCTDALRDALKDVKLIITFNGNTHDLPKLRSEFPGAIPVTVASLDLFEVAQALNLKAGLKLLEGQFNIERPEWVTRKRFIAVKLWRLWSEKNMERALKSLLDYNAQDAENLYFLANELAFVATDQRQRRIDSIFAAIVTSVTSKSGVDGRHASPEAPAVTQPRRM